MEQLAGRVENIKRGTIFFKWYGINLDSSIAVPTFYEEYRYVKTIGVSIFNKNESTDEHFGPLRATLRVLFNINDIEDRGSYVRLRKLENHWCENKLFIFDDTLSHQSINQTDVPRYCLFIDILRRSQCRVLLNFIVDRLGAALLKSKFIFYGSWVPIT